MKNGVTKWRLEYWQYGRKRVRTFGSEKQARRFVEKEKVESISLTPFQEKETITESGEA